MRRRAFSSSTKRGELSFAKVTAGSVIFYTTLSSCLVK
jgi:hypothetical protein